MSVSLINTSVLKTTGYTANMIPSFTGRNSSKIFTEQEKIAMMEEYNSGTTIKELSDKYKISLSHAAKCVDEAIMVSKYLYTDKTMQEIADEHYVTKQTVNNSLVSWGYSAKDKAKKVSSSLVLAILNAKNQGLSDKEIVNKFAMKYISGEK